LRRKGKSFFYGWRFIRRYTEIELGQAKLFHLLIQRTFEPSGEECGTTYDESIACNVCGSNARQKNWLTLKQSSVPKTDIARTIAGEVIVSRRFADVLPSEALKGISLAPIVIGPSGQVSRTHYQVDVSGSPEIELRDETLLELIRLIFRRRTVGKSTDVRLGT